MLENKKKELVHEKKLKSRDLFMKNYPIYRIASEVGIKRDTVYKWVAEDSWEEEREKLIKKTTDSMDIDVIEEKRKSLMMIKASEFLYAAEIKRIQDLPDEDPDKKLPDSVDKFSRLQKVKWEILLPRTISQFNFMKQENTVNVVKQEELQKVYEVLTEDDN